ncbi:MAG TPA: Ku protein [Candidatus Limnocylindrales bacterium]|jgi:DNA end-binding protein Ku|nr:Ku protein [Candidatus Limnocylindrales bacterium]
MRSIWKGHIRFSLVTIPIRIYNAVDTEETIRFNQLHKEDNGPVGYEKKCKKCGKSLTVEEIVKGYQFEPEQYVIVAPEDLEKIKLKSTKVIEIEGFIDSSEVHPTLYDAPYFAGPDGAVAAKTYSLLTQALKASGKVGVGKVVLRDREEVVMIAPLEGGLVLYKLRNPKELRKIETVPQLEQAQVNKDELKLSISLVESMGANLNELDLTDRYRDALREMIDAKIAGKQIVTSPEEEKPVVDIMTALKQSIERTKAQKKPMEKAKGEKKPAVEAKPVKQKKQVA